MNKKMFLSIIVVVVIVAVLYFFAGKKEVSMPVEPSPSPEVSSSAGGTSQINSLYVNKTYKYSIQYPYGLPVEERSPERVSIGNVPYEPAPGAIFINAMPGKNLSYVDEFKQGYPDGCKELAAEKISGMETKKLSCIGAFAGGEEIDYFVTSGGNLYLLSYMVGDVAMNTAYEKAIASFRLP